MRENLSSVLAPAKEKEKWKFLNANEVEKSENRLK